MIGPAVVELGGCGTSKLTIACFPGAGESASRFSGWGHLVPGASVIGLERAGHGTRMPEPPESSLEAVASEAAASLGLLGTDLLLVGHSAGSLVAHAVAELLTEYDSPHVLGLVALNGRSPTVDDHIPWWDLDDEELAQTLARGRPEIAALMSRRDVRELFMPGLRADLELYRRVERELFGPVELPVVAIGGVDDQLIPSAHFWAWRDATRSAFTGWLTSCDHSEFVDDPARALPLMCEVFQLRPTERARSEVA